MTRFLKLLGGAALALSVTAGTAHATVVYVTYEGVVSDVGGADQGDAIFALFGGGNLVGQHYTASYVFDVVYGLNNSNCDDCASPPITQHSIEGGSINGPTNVSPSLGASLTIGGHTETLGGAFFGYILGYNDSSPGGTTQQVHDARDDSSSRVLVNHIINNNGINGLPGEIVLSVFDYIVDPGDSANGSFCIDNGESCIFFTPTSLHITTQAPGTVPLPGALPLFVSGLAGLGLLARRKKRQA
jgi:hypothetical protein